MDFIDTNVKHNTALVGNKKIQILVITYNIIRNFASLLNKLIII